MTKELVLRITKDDMTWDYTRGSGKGGQKRNKTSNAVRCTHPPSRAVGFAEDTRSQVQNKRLAWERCVNSEKFQVWLKVEHARKTGALAIMESEIDQAMRRKRDFRTEVFDTKAGHWVPAEIPDE